MADFKWIRIKIADEIPPYGTHVVLDYSGQLLLSRFNARTDIEIFKGDYEYWLLKVPDGEEELKETLVSTMDLLDKSIEQFTEAKAKIQELQKQIKNKR